MSAETIQNYEGFSLRFSKKGQKHQQELVDNSEWSFEYVIDNGDLDKNSVYSQHEGTFPTLREAEKAAHIFVKAQNVKDGAWGCFCNLRMDEKSTYFRCVECHCSCCESCCDNGLCPECEDAQKDDEENEDE